METLTHLWAALSESGALLLLRWSWQALLLLGGAWLAVKCYRSQAPALRHQLWLCALVAITVLPLWAAVTFWVPVPQPTSKALIYFVELPTAIFAPAPEPVTEPDSERTAAPSSSFSFWSLLLAGWIVGALIALGRLAIFYLRLRGARMKAQLVSLSALGCDNLNTAWPTTASLPIRISPEVRSPILTGVWRPMILLPADILAWTTAEERRAMLQHELTHFERRDHYANCFQSWLSAIFFFHPLVRYACRQLHLEREMACDDYVLSLGTTAVAYAESLLKVAERNLSPVGLYQPAFLGSKKTLERRIEMIMNHHRPPRGATRWPWLALPVISLSVMIWLLVPVSGESIQPDQVLPLDDMPSQQATLLPPPPPEPWPGTAQGRKDLPPPPPPPPPAIEDQKKLPPPPPPPTRVVKKSKGVIGEVVAVEPGTVKRSDTPLSPQRTRKAAKSPSGNDEPPPPPPPSPTPKVIKVVPKVNKSAGNPSSPSPSPTPKVSYKVIKPEVRYKVIKDVSNLSPLPSPTPKEIKGAGKT